MRTEYGWVEIDQIRYDHDIVIHPDRSVCKRRKKRSKRFKRTFGHTPLTDRELEFLDEEMPSVVYIGTGQFDELPLTMEALRKLSCYTAFLRPTPEIVRMLETEHRPFAAILHVSC
jgi:hypothetical protein